MIRAASILLLSALVMNGAVTFTGPITLSQIKVGRTNSTSGFDGATFYVDTASTAGGNGTTSATVGDNRAFASLAEALVHDGLDIDSPRRILCVGTAEDTAQVVHAQWNSVDTTPANYLLIEGNNTTGKWNSGAYRLAGTNINLIYNNRPGHLRFKNLQGKLRGTSSGVTSAMTVFRGSTQNVGEGRTDCDIRFENCIAEISQTGSDDVFGFYNSDYAVSSALNKIRLFNCLVYSTFSDAAGYTIGYGSAWSGVENYNCTSVSNRIGFVDAQITINCLSAFPLLVDFESVGTGGGLSDYNASSDTSAVGSNSRISQTFTFVDPTTYDFHLSASDGGARNFGVTGPGGGFFSTDIDGQTRSGSWDIGADEQQ